MREKKSHKSPILTIASFIIQKWSEEAFLTLGLVAVQEVVVDIDLEISERIRVSFSLGIHRESKLS